MLKKAIALAALLTIAAATPASAGSQRDVNNPNTIQRIHRQVCPDVTEYTNCATIAVQVGDFGATGWIGSSGPASHSVRYNTHYTATADQWRWVIAHEMGGHQDVWDEMVARGSVAQAWVDYYELDTLAQQWLATKGRTMSTDSAKEVIMECEGPATHGITIPFQAWDSTNCAGWRGPIEQAIATP